MALEEKKQSFGGSGISRSGMGGGGMKGEMPPKDTSILGGKPFVQGENVRNWARSDSAFKKTGLSQVERMQRAEKIYKQVGGEGGFLNKQKLEMRLKKLEMEKFQTKTDTGIKEISKDIKVLKGMLGK